MARSHIADEVQVFRFFDEAPLEKVETVFKLVSARVRTRMGSSSAPRTAAKRPTPSPAPRVSPPATSG